jgi:hypothetical protein
VEYARVNETEAAAAEAKAEGLVSLTDRELATVLAALRHWQRAAYRRNAMGGPNALPEWDIATQGDELKELSYTEIDALCERLNSGG